MAFLDHSSNNIIIDAVLTDAGRRKLADNNGSFKVAFFSLADDEVDYSIIEQYGRTVGKEKITKNTPVFEAQTAGDLALKYRLLTLPDSTIVRLPTLSINSTNLTSNSLSLGRTSVTKGTVNVKQTIQGNTKIPDGMIDQTFTLFVPDRFLKLSGNKSPLQIEPTTRIASYNLEGSSNGAANGGMTSFEIEVQPGLDDTSFTVYGNGSVIRTVVSIVGDASGLRKDFEVTISK